MTHLRSNAQATRPSWRHSSGRGTEPHARKLAGTDLTAQRPLNRLEPALSRPRLNTVLDTNIPGAAPQGRLLGPGVEGSFKMRQCNRNPRVGACSAALILLLTAGGLASCGGSTSKTPGTATSASASSPSSTSTSTNPPSSSNNGNGGTSGPTGTSQNSGSKADKPSSSAPAARASSFVACMRSRGIQLPAVKRAGKGATLDFKGVDTHSAQYKGAIATCARELLGKLTTRTRKGKKIRLKGIHVTGINLKSIHIGHVELPNLHVSTPSIKVTTPAPDLGGQSNGEAPTQTNQGATG